VVKLGEFFIKRGRDVTIQQRGAVRTLFDFCFFLPNFLLLNIIVPSTYRPLVHDRLLLHTFCFSHSLHLLRDGAGLGAARRGWHVGRAHLWVSRWRLFRLPFEGI